jgi:cytochrome d ubiquinol oxidase subunit II
VPDRILIDLVAAAGLLFMIAYAIFGGADFGGGVWDLLARGPRKGEQREAIARAMGPVWEANHVWLIFVVVLFFTAFPAAWSAYVTALFAPLRLVLVGIALRGVAFVFRAYAPHHGALRAARWGPIFGGASILTPFLLGACVGAVSSGGLRVELGREAVVDGWPWLSPIALSTGAAAASLCAYVAAVFLCVETEGELREDFRRRALVSAALVLGGALATLPFTAISAPNLWRGLVSPQVLPILGAGTFAAIVAIVALVRRAFRLARVAVALQVALVIAGWALAQYPFLIYPDVTLASAAAPRATLLFVVGSLPFGAALVGPSMWLLFRVFKAAPRSITTGQAARPS